MVYKTKGTCSSEIEFEVENGILTDIHFVGGCQGNTTGVAALGVRRSLHRPENYTHTFFL